MNTMPNEGRSPFEERRPAIFLDKDGTLVNDVPYNIDPLLVTFSPHAMEALHLLQQYGYRLFVVTNQAGIAKGFFTERELDQFQDYFANALMEKGIQLTGFYYCPHHPDGAIEAFSTQCTCRKPMAGMLFEAAHEHGIDLKESWMIGDILHDVEAGNRAGCKTILIDNGNETEWQMSSLRIPHLVVSDLLEAAHGILTNNQPLRYPQSTGSLLEKYLTHEEKDMAAGT